MALERRSRIEDLGRVGRNNQLSARLDSHQAPQDQSMPLRVQMELGLINEDDPFSALAQR